MIKLLNKMFAMLLVILFFSCEKGNTYYENYENNIKTFDGDTYEYLSANRSVFDSLLLVLDRVFPLQDSLREEGITFFAPTNQSFSLALYNLNTQRRLADKSPVYLEDITKNDLDTLMSRYLFKEIITTNSIRNKKDGIYLSAVKYDYKMHVQFKVLNAMGYVGGGQHQIVFTDPNNSIFERYWESTTTNSVNVFTKNGVVHILTPAHDFGFGKMGKYTN